MSLQPSLENKTSMIPPEIVKSVLAQLGPTRVVLLRGRESILCGEPQNDIDIYTPHSADEIVCNLTEILDLKSLTRTGRKQFRAIFEVPGENIIIPIDIFNEVTWRGIPMIDIKGARCDYCDELRCTFLDARVSLWLTVLKNALHGSTTPSHKIQKFSENYTFPILSRPCSSFAINLESRLGRGVWALAKGQEPNPKDVLFARFYFVALRLLDNPVGTALGFWGWLRAKVLHP